MSSATVQPYAPEMAPQVAELIELSLAEGRAREPITHMFAPPERLGVPRALEMLTGGEVRGDLSFVAMADGHPVAAVIARGSGDEACWWRIVTALAHRRGGLASACLSAAEADARADGVKTVTTDDPLDSRWEAAGKLLLAAGYELVDPSRRNISMGLDMSQWRERPVELADGCELVTFSEERLDSWTECRNRAFDTDSDPAWFREHFMGRSDFDPAGWHMIVRDGEVVAISAGVAGEDSASPGVVIGGQIEWVGVLPECRGLKLGEAIVVACLNYLAGREVARTVLATQPFRVPAVKLYEKLGFTTFAAWHKYTKAL
jgi:ribosomal protein S18 acetylase RimI-like enzyme